MAIRNSANGCIVTSGTLPCRRMMRGAGARDKTPRDVGRGNMVRIECQDALFEHDVQSGNCLHRQGGDRRAGSR